MKRLLSIFILITFISGCSPAGYYHFQQKILAISDGSRFNDLPVPSGFKFLPMDSFVHESAKVRICVLVYVGGSWPQDVIEFYKNSMPRHDWETINIIESRDSILSFMKDAEICIIQYTLRGRKGTLTISVSPFSGKPTAPAPALAPEGSEE